MPTSQQFAHSISLTLRRNYFYTTSTDYGSISVTDAAEAGDDTAQLGDIADDNFSTTVGGDAPVPGNFYVGRTANGFVGDYQGEGSYYLYTDNTYAAGQKLTSFVDDDPADPTTHFALVCYVSGTMISTLRGGIPVEDLAVGDLAVTASGQHRSIRWIGHRDIDCAAAATPSETYPVRILAGAFGGGLPERDLFLSPGHPVLVGEGDREVLVPIMCLINGTSIARVPVGRVTYWHVELDRHDLLLAEGLPAESFLDFGNRPWFENGADHALANPDFIPPGLDGRCRPVATDGPLVEAERRRLDALFEMGLAAQCAWPSRDEAWAAL